MLYVAFRPDGSPAGVRASMADAQALIAEIEPDVMEQCKYQIHPVKDPEDAERLKINLHWKITIEKFDDVTGELVETIEREGVN